MDRHRGAGGRPGAYPGLHLVAQVPGNWKRPSVLQNLPAVLRAHPEVNLIFAHNDRMALGAYQVCKQLGLDHRIRVVGVDGLPGAQGGIQLVQDGVLAATLLYLPGGEEAIRTAMNILQHRPYAKENILGTMVIDSTNVLPMKMQTEQLASQQQDIKRQQRLMQQQRDTYASQQTVLYVLLVAAGLGLAGPAHQPPHYADAGRAKHRNSFAAQPASGVCQAGQGRNRGQAALLHQTSRTRCARRSPSFWGRWRKC